MLPFQGDARSIPGTSFSQRASAFDGLVSRAIFSPSCWRAKTRNGSVVGRFLALDTLGTDPSFPIIFDLKKYNETRYRYVAQSLPDGCQYSILCLGRG
jgi:hypothetical protein